MKKAPDDVLAAMEEIITYNWDGELEDFNEMHNELDSPGDHIFSQLVLVNNWLHDYNLTPKQYLEGYTE